MASYTVNFTDGTSHTYDNVPENVYLNIMNKMKVYHEHGNNEHEIREYASSNVNKELYNKIKNYLEPKQKKSVKIKFDVELPVKSCNHWHGCMLCFCTLGTVATFVFMVVSKLTVGDGQKAFPPPFFNSTK
jgi:hypothetical protein